MHDRVRLLVPAVLFFLGLAAVATAADRPEWSPLPPSAWEESARPDSGGRDAIILLDEGRAEDRGTSFRYRLFRRMHIFTEEGRSSGKVEVDYSRKGTKLVSIRARSIRRDGTTTELAPDQILTSTILKSGGNEYFRASAIVPGIEPDCIVEYEYSLEGKYDGLWSWPWTVQNDVYTLVSHFTWIPEKDGLYDSKWSMRNLSESYSGKTCVPDCRNPKEVSFTVHAIPGASAEEWSPPAQDAGPSIFTYQLPPGADAVGYWSFWKAVFDAYTGEFVKDLGGLVPVVDQAKARAGEPLDQLDGVARWLRANIRSTAERSWQEIQDGRGDHAAWISQKSVARMIEQKEGSPFEINLALAAAAERLGLDAKVCLVRDRREGAFDYDRLGALPTEPITAVKLKTGKAWVYYQPASRFSLPRNVPWYLRGGYGLVAGKGQELTTHLAAEDGAAGEDLWTLDLTLAPDGNLSGSVLGLVSGEQGRSYRSWLWTEDPARATELLAAELSASKTPDLTLDAPNLTVNPDSALRILGKARYSKLAVRSGKALTLPLEDLVPWRMHGTFEPEKRSLPVDFKYPRREVLTVDLHVPASALVEELPRSREFSNRLGEWRAVWTRLPDGGVRWTRTLEVAAGNVPAHHYADVREYFRALDEADRELLVIGTP